MRKVMVEKTVYVFSELSDEIQNRLVEDYVGWHFELVRESDEFGLWSDLEVLGVDWSVDNNNRLWVRFGNREYGDRRRLVERVMHEWHPGWTPTQNVKDWFDGQVEDFHALWLKKAVAGDVEPNLVEMLVDEVSDELMLRLEEHLQKLWLDEKSLLSGEVFEAYKYENLDSFLYFEDGVVYDEVELKKYNNV